MAISDAGQIESLAQLEQMIENIENTFADPSRGYPPIWYRGQSKANWSLQPGALRPPFLSQVGRGNPQTVTPPNEDFEFVLLENFRLAASHIIPRDITRPELYFLAQHHGVPTRLLDWTTSAVAALFFAVAQNYDDDGAVFAANARNVYPLDDEKCHGKWYVEVQRPSSPCIEETITYAFGEGKRPTEPLVHPVLPDRRVGRLFQQSACFTLHMPGSDPLEDQAEQIWKYIIPAQAKKVLQFKLRRIGVHWGTIFGDLDNVAKEIRAAHGLA